MASPKPEPTTDGEESLFSQFVEAPLDQRQQLASALLRVSDPLAITKLSQRYYEKTSREAYLLDALSLLEDFGEAAWPALRQIARHHWDRVDLFMNLIATCPGVSDPERISVLEDLAKHPDPFRRSQLFEYLDDCSADVQKHILELLAEDQEDEIREEAKATARAKPR